MLPATIASLWKRHCRLARIYRAGARKLVQIRHQLGLDLAAYRDNLATAGCEGKFKPWLRANKIPVSTAYRLMDKALHRDRPRPGRPPKPIPPTELREGVYFSTALPDRHYTVIRPALQHLSRRGLKPEEINEIIVSGFIQDTQGFLRDQLTDLRRRDQQTPFTFERLATMAPISITGN